jgi:hypothetical protein
MFVLPISRTPVELRVPTGQDEMMISGAGGVHQRVEVVRRLAPPARSGVDWHLLPYVDVDAALLGLRQFLYGDKLVAEIQCPACGAWGDIQLSIAEYLRANRPPSRRVEAPSYVPTVRQVLSVIAEYGPGEAGARALEAECLSDCCSLEAQRKRAELEKAAPCLAGHIEGLCPHCGMVVTAWFDPGGFVLGELGIRATALLQEVHLLASRYGWSEETILALPEQRRAAYAASITEESYLK